MKFKELPALLSALIEEALQFKKEEEVTCEAHRIKEC
jgi:hypothetical protein